MFHHPGPWPNLFDLTDSWIGATRGVRQDFFTGTNIRVRLAVLDIVAVNFVNSDPIVSAVLHFPRHQIRVQRVRVAPLVLILNQNVVRVMPLTPPGAVGLWCAVRAGAAIHMLS